MFLNLDYSTPLSINSRGRSLRSETSSLKVQTMSSSAQRWDLEITLAPSSSTEAIPAAGRLSVHRAINGTHTPFDIPMPQHVGVEDLVSGAVASLSMRGSTPAGSSDVAVKSTSVVVIPSGLFVTVNGSPKVYITTESTTITPGDATATLSIFPPLVVGTVNDTVVDVAPDISVYYAANGTDGVTYEGGVVVSARLSLVEALT